MRDWNPETEAAFLVQIRRGNYVEVACNLVGLPRTTLYRRLRAGRLIADEQPEHPDALFVLAVEVAQAEAEDRLRAIVDRAAEGFEVIRYYQELDKQGNVHDLVERKFEFSWQAAITRLERMHPERYQRRKTERIEQEVRERIEVQIVLPDNGRPAGGALPGEVIDADSAEPGPAVCFPVEPG